MNKPLLAAVIVVVFGIGVFAAYKYSKNSNVTYTPSTASPSTTTDYNTNTNPAASASAKSNTVTTVKISATGFDPMIVRVKVGDQVSWTNSDSAMHNVSSDPHPTHTAFPDLNLGNIAAGESKSLTFTEPGTHKYHDHLHSALTGQVVVSP